MQRECARFVARGAGAMLHSVTKIELSGRPKMLNQVSTSFAALVCVDLTGATVNELRIEAQRAKDSCQDNYL